MVDTHARLLLTGLRGPHVRILFCKDLGMYRQCISTSPGLIRGYFWSGVAWYRTETVTLPRPPAGGFSAKRALRAATWAPM